MVRALVMRSWSREPRTIDVVEAIADRDHHSVLSPNRDQSGRRRSPGAIDTGAIDIRALHMRSPIPAAATDDLKVGTRLRDNRARSVTYLVYQALWRCRESARVLAADLSSHP
jgi:hypothetical protein